MCVCGDMLGRRFCERCSAVMFRRPSVYEHVASADCTHSSLSEAPPTRRSLYPETLHLATQTPHCTHQPLTPNSITHTVSHTVSRTSCSVVVVFGQHSYHAAVSQCLVGSRANAHAFFSSSLPTREVTLHQPKGFHARARCCGQAEIQSDPGLLRVAPILLTCLHRPCQG